MYEGEKQKEQLMEEIQFLKKKINQLQDLQKENERFMLLVQTMPDITYEVDFEGRIVFISDAIRQLGYEPQELVGKHFKLMIHPEDLEKVSRFMVLPKYKGKVTGDAGAPKLFDERRTGKRMTKYLEVRLMPKNLNALSENYRYGEIHSAGRWDRDVRDKDKRLLGSIGIIRDITPRKQAEMRLQRAYEEIKLLCEKLEQKNQELQKLDRLKSEFISNVSHELRTPLTIIKEGVELVLDEIPGKIVQAQRDILTVAQKNIRRLSNIIDSLLDISKIESGKMELYKELVNINELIRGVIFDFKHLGDKKQIHLDFQLPEKEISIFCDGEKVRQVLVNFVSNALKFTPEGGKVTVTGREEGGKVIVCVQDTGIGIAQEDIPKLFNKFIQLGRKPGPGEKGTGLGLAIAKGIIEEHRGRVWVESELNKGSKFYFSLPEITFDEVLKEYLGREIKKSQAKESFFSILMLKVEEKDSSGERKILPKIGELVKNSLRTKIDILLQSEEEIFIILPATARDSAEIVLKRIREKLEEFVSGSEDLKTKIKFQYRILSYPQEVKNEEEILEKLKEVRDVQNINY